MVPKNLHDYIKVYKDFLDRDLCTQTVKKLTEINWEDHSFYDYQTNAEKIEGDHLAVTNDFFDGKEIITNKIWLSLEQYVLKDFSDFVWFSGWHGFSLPRFNRYNKNTKMRIHCDHIHSLFDGEAKGVPFLTVLGALNNDYEGGEFVMFGDTEIEFPAGSIMVFPSNFMFPHEVRPVTAGTRYSYVSWAW